MFCNGTGLCYKEGSEFIQLPGSNPLPGPQWRVFAWISGNENLTASSWICYTLTVMKPQNFRRLWKQILVRSIPHQRQMCKSLWKSLYKGSHDSQHRVSRCLLYPILNQCSVIVSPYPIPSSSDILQCPWHTHSFSHVIIHCAFNYNWTSNMAFWIIPCSQS